jgi:hypothetical protein
VDAPPLAALPFFLSFTYLVLVVVMVVVSDRINANTNVCLVCHMTGQILAGYPRNPLQVRVFGGSKNGYLYPYLSDPYLETRVGLKTHANH